MSIVVPELFNQVELVLFDASSLSVSNTIFNYNTAQQAGGGIYTSAIDELQSSDNEYSQNQALSRNGGGIYTKAKSTGQFLVQNDTYSGNTANLGGGGAIFWSPPDNVYPDTQQQLYFTSAPIATNQVMFDNAAAYGPNLGSVVLSFMYDSIFLQRFSSNSNASSCANAVGMSGCIPLIDSGLPLPSAFIPLFRAVDWYNNTVVLSAQQLSIQANVLHVSSANVNGINNEAMNASAVLTGTTIKTVNGPGAFNDLTITAPPNSIVELVFTSEIAGHAQVYSLTPTIHYQTKHCPPGTFISTNLHCESCAANLYSWNEDSLTCFLCDENTVCQQQSASASAYALPATSISAIQGKWLYRYRDSKSDSIIGGSVSCPNNLCIGNNQCAEGRVEDIENNILCGKCKPGLNVWGNDCVDCSNPNAGILFLLICISVIQLLFQRDHSRHSSLQMALFFYFVQMSRLFLTSTSASTTRFKAMSSIKWISIFDLAPQEINVSCAIQLNDYGYILLNLLSPFGLTLLLLVLMAIHYGLFRIPFAPIRNRIEKWEVNRTTINEFPLNFRDSYIRAFIGLALAGYQQITNVVFNALYHIQVPIPNGTGQTTQVLFFTPSIEVHSPAYRRLLPFLVFLLIFVVIGLPTAILLFIYKYRSLLHTQSMLTRYGILYEAFNKEGIAIYGGFIMIIRRTAIIAFFVFFSHDSRTRYFICILLELSYLLFHIYIQPHRNWIDNQVEFLIHFTLILILLICLVYEGNSAAMIIVSAMVIIGSGLLIVYLAVVKIKSFHTAYQRKTSTTRPNLALENAENPISPTGPRTPNSKQMPAQGEIGMERIRGSISVMSPSAAHVSGPGFSAIHDGAGSGPLRIHQQLSLTVPTDNRSSISVAPSL